MKDKILFLIRKIYRLTDKIAFYPTLLAVLGLIFTYAMIYLEEKGISKYLLETFPALVINNTETARSLLTTFIAGLISIMVFSFSMVMILLNQASSNFSPRLLPGLISNKRHQIILGFYIASILYCTFILVYIEPDGDKYQLPGFAVLFAILFMVNCLAAFIYFIHSISQEIQINNILDKIFNVSKHRMLYLIENEKYKEGDFASSNSWQVYKSKKSGYLQNVSVENIAKIAKAQNVRIDVMVIKGLFVSEENIIFKSEKQLDDDVIDRITEHFDFSKSEVVEDNYVLAFKQITEVAVKAMSPGINDPGTALNAIDYLSQLFSLRIHKNDKSLSYISEVAYVSMATVNFKTLIFQVMAELRTYCKHDVVVVEKLLMMLLHLKNIIKEENKKYQEVLDEEIANLILDAEASISNKRDLNFIKSIV
ncbi:DUF2254 domain-containing protein [Mariniflexile litorale]|uniref:DUF2254 domain-containing protein n=1 Tax=Mariniflexile litorale TaxID=3045158 RepID=A0AAU7EIL7_9FLAO|nr:DUF2254 domain-containing protein [Mariniflexile sp. KMM 9835]MDQ8211054.1 DUF2254 domain-containing protein [Mariniflexile sp. KMM 9835]